MNSEAQEPVQAQSAAARFQGVLRRVPFATVFTLALLATAVASGTLFSAAIDKPWFENVGTGLPAFVEGRWWSIITSPFFVERPILFLPLLLLVVGGIGWAEWQFGTLRTIGIFLAGHVLGVLGAAGIVALAAPSGWPWAAHLATAYDVGPSCGAIATLVFAVATLPSPWRMRVRLVIVVWIIVSVLYLGRLADLEHAVMLAVALGVTVWLPAFRRRGHTSQWEARVIAFWLMITIGAIQVIDLMLPDNWPLGEYHPTASIFDVAVDVVVTLLILNGIRRGFRVAWVVAIIMSVFNLLTAAASVAIISIAPEADDFVLDLSPAQLLASALPPAFLWLTLLIVLITRRSAFRVRLRSSDRTLAAAPLTRDELIDRLRRFGGGTISCMATWEGNRRVAVADGAIAYQSHSGVAIVLGDPIVEAGREGEALAEFERATHHAGLVQCAFSVSQATVDAAPEGWHSVVIAEDTIVDLPGLAFKGKSWSDVRTAINRASREGIELHMGRLADEPWRVLAQVRAISEQWMGDRGLPEMRFTLGTVEEARDPETLVAVAIDAEGNLHGVTSWLPVYGPVLAEGGEPRVIGWTLDLMRRREGGFGPVMEFLIGAAAQRFSEQGYEFLSLSGAPLVRPEGLAEGPVDRVLEQIGDLIEPLYGFKSLHRFKQKFSPRNEPMYLLFRDEGNLPRIGLAITRAYLPDASMRDLVASAASIGKPE